MIPGNRYVVGNTLTLVPGFFRKTKTTRRHPMNKNQKAGA